VLVEERLRGSEAGSEEIVDHLDFGVGILVGRQDVLGVDAVVESCLQFRLQVVGLSVVLLARAGASRYHELLDTAGWIRHREVGHARSHVIVSEVVPNFGTGEVGRIGEVY